MIRKTHALARHRRRKRLFKMAKGYWGDRKNHIRLTKDAVLKALCHSYRHRRTKKRDFRRLWITRLSTAVKMRGISYSRFIHGLTLAGCLLDRKVLSAMALSDPTGFDQVVALATTAIEKKHANT